MHDFDPSDRTARRPERLEAPHRSSLAFHRAMVLFHDIVEIFALPDSDACLVGLVIMRNRRGITPTLSNRELLREPVVANGLG